MLDYAKETGGYTPRFIKTTFTRAGTKSGMATASGCGADSIQGISPRMTMDKNRVRQLLALWAVVLAGMAAFAAVVLLHLQNNAF